MFSFFLATLTCEASFSEFILGEWYVERIADNDMRTKALEDQIYSIEFHKFNDSDKIVGTIFKNNLLTDFDEFSESGFVDTFEVEITDVKLIMASQKNYIGQKLELEYTDNEGKWALTGKILDEEITITFNDQKTADVLFNGTQYIFERESWPEAAPLSEQFKMAQEYEQKAPRQLSFYETVMIALAPYKKYKYLLYTAALIFIAETIILTCGFPCFGRSEKKHKAPVKNADDPKKDEEEEEKTEKANEEEAAKEKKAAKEEESKK